MGPTDSATQILRALGIDRISLRETGNAAMASTVAADGLTIACS